MDHALVIHTYDLRVAHVQHHHGAQLYEIASKGRLRSVYVFFRSQQVSETVRVACHPNEIWMHPPCLS